MKNITEIDNLLARHFSKEPLSNQEEKDLERWIEENKSEYDRLKNILEESETFDNIEFDTSAAWKKVDSQLKNRIHFNTHRLYSALGYAASLLLIIGIIIFWNNNSRVERFAYVNSTDVKENIMLPDSSSVVLFPDSKIQYKALKKKGSRQVILAGKAFFDVKPKGGREFIIDAYNVKVEVLGTSFLIDAYIYNETEVYVKNGIVKVEADNNNVILKANEQAKVVDGNIIKKSIPDSSNIFENKIEVLNFNNASIVEVVKKLEKIFDIKIDLGNKVKKNRITTQLKVDNLENILLELSYICNCECDTISERHYKLYYP